MDAGQPRAAGERGERLFVAVWPPPDIVALLGDLPRSELTGVRWCTPDQWHVTLRFLGYCDPPTTEAYATGLASLSGLAPAPATLGPATARLGRGVLVVPVSGVAPLAEAAAGLAPLPDQPGRTFEGHLTLARGRGGRPLPAALAGQPVRASWLAGEITLVRSRLGDEGARYEIVERVMLTGKSGDGPPERA